MIIIAPFAQKLLNGKENPKNYPIKYWDEVIAWIAVSFPKQNIVQVGVSGEMQLISEFIEDLPLKKLEELIDNCQAWIGVDSMFQHLCWLHGKRGICIFGKSDPLIFGHSENINIIKDRAYLRTNQFGIWEEEEYDKNVFPKPEIVCEALQALLQN